VLAVASHRDTALQLLESASDLIAEYGSAKPYTAEAQNHMQIAQFCAPNGRQTVRAA
jgi:hypothetical protein